MMRPLKISLFFFLPSFFIYAGYQQQTAQCQFPPLVEGERWDTFWTQHYVGGRTS